MKFWKMNGAGNDFIIINNMVENLPAENFPQIAAKLCERHLSIGADGFMVVEKPEHGGDIKMLFYNSDGSEGEMCGNGARCICRYAYENGLAGEIQRVETPSGIVIGKRLDERNYRVRLNPPTLVKSGVSLEAGGKNFPCTYVELGTPGLPHAVVPYEGLKSESFDTLRVLGKEMRFSGEFPKGANINFYERQSDGRVLIRTYERGVEDLTYACGTGTGSVAYVLHLQNNAPGGKVNAAMLGGELSVDIAEEGEETALYLTGPTNIAAKGDATDEELIF